MNETYECTFCRREAKTYGAIAGYARNPDVGDGMPQERSYGPRLLRSRCCWAPVVSRGFPGLARIRQPVWNAEPDPALVTFVP